MVDPNVHSVDEVFSQLSPDDEKDLVSLPYRIGLYVSYADVSGGWDAQERELQSLSEILREFSEDFAKTEFAQRVLMETLMNRDSWPGWAHRIDQVPEQIRRLNRVLSPMFMPDEYDGFKAVLVDIALSVAMAFREGKGEALPDSGNGVYKLAKGAIVRLRGGKGEKPLDHVNISDGERAALQNVCAALEYRI